MRIVKAMEAVKGKLQIVTNARVTQTVKMVRLEKFLNLRPSLDEALEDLA